MTHYGKGDLPGYVRTESMKDYAGPQRLPLIDRNSRIDSMVALDNQLYLFGFDEFPGRYAAWSFSDGIVTVKCHFDDINSLYDTIVYRDKIYVCGRSSGGVPQVYEFDGEDVRRLTPSDASDFDTLGSSFRPYVVADKLMLVNSIDGSDNLIGMWSFDGQTVTKIAPGSGPTDFANNGEFVLDDLFYLWGQMMDVDATPAVFSYDGREFTRLPSDSPLSNAYDAFVLNGASYVVTTEGDPESGYATQVCQSIGGQLTPKATLATNATTDNLYVAGDKAYLPSYIYDFDTSQSTNIFYEFDGVNIHTIDYPSIPDADWSRGLDTLVAEASGETYLVTNAADLGYSALLDMWTRKSGVYQKQTLDTTLLTYIQLQF